MSGQLKECRCVELINALKKFSHELPEDSKLTSEAHTIKEIKELVVKKMGASSSSSSTSESLPITYIQQPKIQKVPAVLRQRDQKQFEKYYEPRWISIGPIHHGKPNLKLAEKYKIEWTAKFIADNRLEVERVYGNLEENIEELKNLFDEEVIEKYDDKTLSLMLFVDGCSILQLIRYCPNNNPVELKKISIKNDQAVFAQQDLFLLENQIPYRVLELLMKDLEDTSKGEIKSSMENFIRANANIDTSMENLKLNPNHLLDLLRSALVPSQTESKDNNSNDAEKQQINQQKCHAPGIDHKGSNCFLRLLEASFMKLLQVFNSRTQEANNTQGTQGHTNKAANCFNRISDLITKLFPQTKSGQQSFRGAGDLKKAGIYFRPSKKRYLGEPVKFFTKHLGGRLDLPPLTVDDSMAPKYLNLIAYEMCPDVKTDYEVTAYISFLDLLIDYPNDVKELRKSHVLFNQLGSDEEVANLFNEIGTDLVFNFSIYNKVMVDVEKHYNNKMKTWIAQVYHAHFSSPWSIVAFLAAFVVLAMTAIQTWRALFPPPGPCDGICKNLQSLVKMNAFWDYFCHNLTFSPASCAKACKAMRIVWK